MPKIRCNPTAGLRQFQIDALFHDKPYGYVEATPQHSGKTTAAYRWDFMMMLKPEQLVWWVSPTDSQAKDVMRRMQKYIPKDLVKWNGGDLSGTLTNGSRIEFKNGARPDNIYGPSINAAVIDEASRVHEDVYTAVYSRTVATNAPLRIVGNKQGRNWFWEKCRLAEQGEPSMAFHKMSLADAVSQGITSQEKADEIERQTPPLRFRELYLLEDVDSFNPFQGYQECTVNGYSPMPTTAIGLDPAREEDEYAIVGIDKDGQVTMCHHWSHTPWETSTMRAKALCGDLPVTVDSTGVGDPYLTTLRAAGISARPYNFTAKSRQALLENLAVEISNQRVHYPKAIADQLATFEYKVNGTGVVSYRCPEHLHDDRVMALALALWQQKNNPANSMFVI